jgi:diketogulonate reductase-like aldo/keto reductase
LLGSVKLVERMRSLKGLGGNIMTFTAYNHVPIPSFMYGTAWKEEATTKLVQLAVASGFKAIDTANQLIHYQEALVGEALQILQKEGIKRDELFLQTKFTSADGQDHRPLTMPRLISLPRSDSPLTAR